MSKQTLGQWLVERRKGIGGSDAAAVLSEGYGCPRALFLDKSGVEPDYRHTDTELGFFERGHALEPIIARKFANVTGLRVRNMPTRVSVERPWMRVNVDRMIHSLQPGDEGYGKYEGPGYLECKTANEHVFANMLQEGMPPHYVIQVQHGLAVTGWNWGHFAVLEPYTFRFLQFRYERDENLISLLLDVEESFWRQVQAGNIPDRLPDFNDDRCEKCVYRRGCRNAEALPAKKRVKKVYEVETAEPFVILAENIVTLSAQAEEIDRQLEEERAKMKILMGEREAVAVPSAGRKFSKTWQSGQLRYDSKALDAEQPHLAEKYKRRGEPYEVLRVYELNEVEGRAEAMKEVA